MKNKQLTVWIIGGIIGIVVGAFFFFTANDTQAGTPSFQVDTEKIELGEIAVQGDYPAEFNITNTGDAPLEISDVRTSCMCTYAEIIIGEEKSPEFNMVMHNSPQVRRWKDTVEPGESAVVRAMYKPHLMPVEGPVERSVIFTTNDPNNREVELRISAIVQK